MKRAIKRAVLSRLGGPTIRFGIARGVRIHVDFQPRIRTYLGLYEVELNRYLRRLLQSGAPAFDVGARHGYDALVIAKHTRARVASFERDPACLRVMTDTLALNPDLGPLITPVEATVGNHDGQLGLDEYAYGVGFVPSFVKLDVEGNELAALHSASRLLAERHPSLIVEVHSAELEHDCGHLLIEHGYRPLVVNQRRVWPDHRPIGKVNRWLVAPNNEVDVTALTSSHGYR
jgi:Methyltransferase FkbM domain